MVRAVSSRKRPLPRKAVAVLNEGNHLALADAPLALVTKLGARLMLQGALEEEGLAFLAWDWDKRRSSRALLGWRHGGKPRTVKGAGGEVTIAMPQVRGAGQPFHSRRLPPSTTRLQELEEAIPLLALHGLSPRRVRKALGKLLGKRGLSQTTVLRLTQKLVEAFQTWRQRDLSTFDVLSRFLDGIRLGVRGGTREKEAILVAHAVLAGALGSRESTRAWTDLLEDLQRRGVRDLGWLLTDGGGGLLAAVETCFPDLPRQHGPKPKLGNVLEKVPKSAQAAVGDAARRGLSAPTREQAEEALRLLERASQKRFPSAVEGLHRDLDACGTSYRFPLSHGKRMRTTNVLERSFREVRRRVREVGRFQEKLRALALVHAVLQEAQRTLATMRVQHQMKAA